ncbi:MAG: sensor histidine kinase [Gammaproteobacteria bacterium]
METGSRVKSEETHFLPDLCGLRPLFVIVVVGELIAITLVLASYGFQSLAFEEFALISLLTQWLGLSAAAVLCVSRRYLMRLSENTAIVVSYLLMMLAFASIAELAWQISAIAAGGGIIEITHFDFLGRVLAIGAIVTALVLRYFYLQHHWRLRTISEAGARLDALQARIRPHFLFNCMNTIASLTRTDPATAEKAIEDLSDLFRASMAKSQTMVSLREELELVKRYVYIESLRLGNRLAVDWTVDDACLDVHIPLLSIQPLIENAIYHGIEPLSEGGTIRLNVSRYGNKVEITVENPVTEATIPHHQGNRLAQENVTERFAAHFGDAASVDIRPDDEGYVVALSLPVSFARPVELHS